eukprot:32455-Amphidinium_carterae.1
MARFKHIFRCKALQLGVLYATHQELNLLLHILVLVEPEAPAKRASIPPQASSPSEPPYVATAVAGERHSVSHARCLKATKIIKRRPNIVKRRAVFGAFSSIRPTLIAI